MNKLFSEFPKPSYNDWVNQLIKDLKGKPETLLQTEDPIEKFSFKAYQHQQSEDTMPPEILKLPHVRNINREDNTWENMATIYVNNETDANKQALNVLNLGITALRFDIKNKNINWKKLLNDIQLKYIQTTFKILTIDSYFEIIKTLSKEELQTVFFEIDPMEISKIDWTKIALSLKEYQIPILCANGYDIQQCGSNTWQEVAYCLASAHEFLVKLINEGLTTDQATKCIHFNVGTSTSYFYEIAKIRALRILWARIVQEYKPEKEQTLYAKITAITGFSNKSLRDPYTNLLRQTTEAMSAIVAGVNAICVQPYDSYSTIGATKLSIRMAANIPLILKEESYLDKVIDPLGGSYAVEHITYKIADRAWNIFQQIEEHGGIMEKTARKLLTEKIRKTAKLRIQRIKDKTDIIIGINEFHNPTKENNEWIPIKKYLNMNTLIIEQVILTDNE